MQKKWFRIFALTAALALAGCGAPEPGKPSGGAPASGANGSVYYLSFKPEQAEQWKELAAKYTDETGVRVTVETSASGNYETQLKSEMAKSNAPTLFQVNGPVGLEAWKTYCYDLSGSAVYQELTNDTFALKDGSAVLGIGYVIETYGLIYNKAKLAEYCRLDNAVIKDPSELNNFGVLKAVAEDMQKRKDELGIQGAFTSAGMDSSSDWRFKTHLANLPLSYEYQDTGVTSAATVQGAYLDNFKAIWDLYIQNATCPPSMLSSKTGDDAAAEFALGDAVFYQNGTWAYNQIRGHEVADEDIGMLPIYIGVKGEENQGLCTGSENYWCVNKNASQADIDATLAFMNWCVTSEAGREMLGREMGFVCPFKGFTEEYTPDNPLIQAANEDLAAGHKVVPWNFSTMPSEQWKNNVGSAMLEYAQGTGDWNKVVQAFVKGWETEMNARGNGSSGENPAEAPQDSPAESAPGGGEETPLPESGTESGAVQDRV